MTGSKFDLFFGPDTTPPVITNNPIPQITNNPNITLSGTVTDSGSGLQLFLIDTASVALYPHGSYSHTLTLKEGPNTIIETTTDRAHNVATVTKIILLDTQAPITTKILGDTDGDGFINSITLTASDPPKAPATLSALVKAIKFSVNGSSFTTVLGSTANVPLPSGSSMSIAFFAVDHAGNAEALTTQTHNIDICQNIAGQFQGCPVADKNIVTLHKVNLGAGPSIIKKELSITTKEPLEGVTEPLKGVMVKVFDRNDPDFQLVAGSKNPDGSKYGIIYEADAGRIASCLTGSDGICFAGETKTGDYLVIVKYFDPETNKTVYVGRPKSPTDFVDTNGDGLGDTATKDFQILKIFRNGVFQEYRGGSKIVVSG